MSLPRWDDEMKFELLRLKSELKPENFRVLHQPMGLGTLTKKPSSNKNPITESTKNLRASPSPLEARPSSPKLRSAPQAAPIPTPVVRTKPQSALLRTFFVHALDISFVLLTVVIGVLLTIWVIDPTHFSKNPELLKRSIPVQFISKNSALALVAGLYAFFSLYWLFFKLVSGSTLGESFLENFRTSHNPRQHASGKASGDS